MAYTTGTATDNSDLLNKLQAYITTQGWTIHDFNAGDPSVGGGFLHAEGPGAGAGKTVFVNIRQFANLSNSQFTWELRGATGYTSGALPGMNQGELTTTPYFNTWNQSMTYWFFVNARRIIVVAKCSTIYVSMYAGFFMPWGTPANYPFPIIIMGDFYTPLAQSAIDSARRMFCDPGHTSPTLCNAWLRQVGGTWAEVANQANGASNDNGIAASDTSGVYSIFPWNPGACATPTTGYGFLCGGGPNAGGVPGGSSPCFLDNAIPTAQGERGLWPAQIYGRYDAIQGALDGVYCPIGSGIATEQIITVGSRTFQCFQNISRSSGNDYFAVEQN